MCHKLLCVKRVTVGNMLKGNINTVFHDDDDDDDDDDDELFLRSG